MKVKVPTIPDEGIEFSFSQNDPWFRGMLAGRLAEMRLDPAKSWARIDLHRTNQNVSLSGEAEVRIQPDCARCGRAFSKELAIDLTRHLVPHFAGPREKLLDDEEAIELSEEDLEFSFYRDEEIDLEDILAEEILLAQPITYLCQESCAGLCPNCGVNLNEKTCGCSQVSGTSPFVVLKDWNAKKKS